MYEITFEEYQNRGALKYLLKVSLQESWNQFTGIISSFESILKLITLQVETLTVVVFIILQLVKV